MPRYHVFRRTPNAGRFAYAGPEWADTPQQAAQQRLNDFPHKSPVGTELIVHTIKDDSGQPCFPAIFRVEKPVTVQPTVRVVPA